MMDQADRLRQMINSIKLKQANKLSPSSDYTKQSVAKIITVTSGKGGVGKTNIAVNLAIALGELGKRVIIIDADLGLANIEVLLGVAPENTLEDVIFNNKSIFDVITTGDNNIRFISGGSGVEALVKLNKDILDKFITNVALLDKICDIILIDTGAGLSDSVMSFVMAADEVILVTTPEPTSITDAYALIKMISARDKDKRINLIVNRAESDNEAKDIIKKITLVAKRFLNIELISLGFVLHDYSVVKSVKMQEPFYLKYPKSNAAQNIKNISKKIIEEDENKSVDRNFGVKVFISKLMGFMRS